MADGITLDKQSYKPGDKATVTVVDSKRTQSTPIQWGTAFSGLTASLVVNAAGKLTAGSCAVTPVSDDGTTAVFTIQL